MHVRPRASSRFFRTVAFFAMSIALAASTVHAAERKKVQVKKQAASATAKQRPVARSATVISRKAVTRVKATPRVSARSMKAATRLVVVPEKLSFGQVAGLHSLADPLDLKSSVALVIDQDTNEVLLSKNDHAVLQVGHRYGFFNRCAIRNAAGVCDIDRYF